MSGNARVLASLGNARRGDGQGSAAPVGVTIVGGAFAGILAGTALAGGSLSPLTWYLARASGFTLYLLFWFVVVSGLGMTTKLLGLLGRDGANWQVHRFATELAFVALAVHLLSLALDPTVPLGPLGVLFPFMSDVRQPWTDLGVVTGWGMVGLAASYGLRRYTGWRGWRLLHYLAFPLWVTGLLHGIGGGSDTHTFWAAGLYLATTAVVVYLSMYRALRWRRRGVHGATHPDWMRDREAMSRRVTAFRERCASLSSKTKPS